MISINFLESCELPIKKPFISFIPFKFSMFDVLTDPPYKTLGSLILQIFLIINLISINCFLRSCIFNTLPVPIDHTGS